MTHAILSGLVQVFQWPSPLYLVIGVVVGIVVGMLPGCGGATAMVLMLPFVFNLRNPVAAFALLLGMHSIVNTSGDVTCILFGVPGEVTTAAMLLDGHPMARNGEAGRALGAAISSNLVGGLIGAAGLFVAIPILEPLAAVLRSPELLMLIFLGLTFIASLSGNSGLSKGLITAGLGLLLGMVGMDPQMGIYRYTFDLTTLMDGLKIIPVALGLFGIPEIIELAVSGTSIARDSASNEVTNVFQGIKDTFIHWWLIVRCSLMGLLLSFVPGIGGSVAQWIIYAHGVQGVDKDKVGKGAIEGVLGPGAGSHAKECGALMPMLAFGIPGSVTMAILLSAFLILGLVPGPDMLTKHLDLTFSLVWILVVANVVSVVLVMLLIKQLAKITVIRGGLLVPVLIMLLFIGAFSATNNNDNIIIMIIFGILGWVMKKLNWPRPPVVLGLVLGSLAEKYLYISVGLSGYRWLMRPGVIIISIIIVISLVYTGVSHLRRQKKTEKVQKPRSIKELLFVAFLVVVFGYAVIDAAQWPFVTRLFPWIIGIPFLLLIIGKLIFEIVNFSRGEKLDKTLGKTDEQRLESRRTKSILAWMLAFLAVVYLLGFPIGLTLACLVYLKFSAKEKWLMTGLFTAGAFGLLYVVFQVGIHLPFTPGILLSLVGISM